MHEIIETQKRRQLGIETKYPVAKIMLDEDILIFHTESVESSFLDHHLNKENSKSSISNNAQLIVRLLNSYMRQKEVDGGKGADIEVLEATSTIVKVKGCFSDILDALIKKGIVSEETGAKLCSSYLNDNISKLLSTKSINFQTRVIALIEEDLPTLCDNKTFIPAKN